MRHGADYPSCIHDRIHPCTEEEEEEEEATFARYKTSHMETDHEEQKAPKMTETNPSSAVDHSSDHQEELVEPEGPTQNHCSNQEETSMVP
jgi:hypothetical protein